MEEFIKHMLAMLNGEESKAKRHLSICENAVLLAPTALIAIVEAVKAKNEHLLSDACGFFVPHSANNRAVGPAIEAFDQCLARRDFYSGSESAEIRAQMIRNML